MSFPFAATSPSTGEVFVSTFKAFNEQGIIPTTPLPHSHPFHSLWQEHLTELTSPHAGPYDSVIDAFVAIAEGSPAWRGERGMTDSQISAKMGGMRELLSQHPPDVVIVSGVDDVYSFHPRRPSFLHFICISEEYIKLWADADKRSDESARNKRSEKLALTALLKTLFDHELGHWLFTLRVRHVSDSKIIPKALGFTWHLEANGEAGKFVEVRSRGGILTYSKETKKAMLRTGTTPANIHILPLSYLRIYGHNHSTRGGSSEQLYFTPSGTKHIGKNKVESDIFFPFRADDEFPPPSSSGRPFVGYCQQRIQAYLTAIKIIQSRRQLNSVAQSLD